MHRPVSSEPGFILMAATNFYDGLDEALVRDLRFDEKIRVDLPDEAAREQILSAQLSKRLWTPFPVDAFAQRTPGWSAAKLAVLVNKAASICRPGESAHRTAGPATGIRRYRWPGPAADEGSRLG